MCKFSQYAFIYFSCFRTLAVILFQNLFQLLQQRSWKFWKRCSGMLTTTMFANPIHEHCSHILLTKTVRPLEIGFTRCQRHASAVHSSFQHCSHTSCYILVPWFPWYKWFPLASTQHPGNVHQWSHTSSYIYAITNVFLQMSISASGKHSAVVSHELLHVTKGSFQMSIPAVVSHELFTRYQWPLLDVHSRME